ncbi:MAG TPA: deoxyribodipyrimidine photo-lyase [Blastocatellia bacterium]|nr:deoxyribodipyrimidine photo-lyase [Blastocatellia bacterium]
MIDKLLQDPRVRVRRDGDPDPEGRVVVYWMQRAQRALDNPAFDVAIKAANELRRPVAVFFGLHPGYPNANLRHYAFLIEGLSELARQVEDRGARFVFRAYPQHSLIRFCDDIRPCLVVGDENPLREPESWRRSAKNKLRAPFWTVDADVVVPTGLFPKEEYAARTLRPKIQRLTEVFLQPSENPQAVHRWPDDQRPGSQPIEGERLLDALPLDRSASPVTSFKGGSAQGLRRLERFITERLADYDKNRNLPHLSGTSELSAYLHFGQISPIRVALAVRGADAPEASKAAFLEELIVRRELAVNYVARNPRYDRFAGCPDWARSTLTRHSADPRPHVYSETDLESASTHDPLWNAAHAEMVTTGRMHGYLRMYWAKKILEWTETPEAAFGIAVKLNDRYELDGRDPNGYAGISWAICGKHDRPWARRDVFGTVRYMSAAGMARKFDADAYIEKVTAMT